MNEEKIWLHGRMCVSAKMFDHRTGEVTVIGDLSYKDRYLEDVPILRLVVENIAHVDLDVIVNDDLAIYLPYLKPIAAFRTAITACLREFCKTSDDVVIKVGIEQYLDELQNFSAKASLLKQAKGAVNKLRLEKMDEARLREIITLCDVVPYVDRQFVII